jgi:hypothetical protein
MGGSRPSQDRGGLRFGGGVGPRLVIAGVVARGWMCSKAASADWQDARHRSAQSFDDGLTEGALVRRADMERATR